MASILKVDTLQKPDGSTPTAADLGIDVAGSVVQALFLKSPDQTQVVVSNPTPVVVDTFTVDVKQSNSRLYVWFDSQQFVKSTASTNPGFELGVDGVYLSGNTENASLYWHVGYGQNAMREQAVLWFVTEPLSAGMHTITMRVSSYLASSTVTVKYQNRYFRYNIQEIAQ